jgi:hypothetical protein
MARSLTVQDLRIEFVTRHWLETRRTAQTIPLIEMSRALPVT